MNALTHFGILVGKKIGTHSLIARLPGLTTVLGRKGPGRGNTQVDFIGVSGVRADAVNHQPAGSRKPFSSTRMLGQRFDLRPMQTAVTGLENRGRSYTGVQHARLIGRSGHRAPDPLNAAFGALGKSDRFFCLLPGPAQISAEADIRPPPGAVHTRIQDGLLPLVQNQMVDISSPKDQRVSRSTFHVSRPRLARSCSQARILHRLA